MRLRAFEEKTGVNARDCFSIEDDIVFVVNEGEAGKAVGKNGLKVRPLRNIFEKNVSVVEFSQDVDRFIKNLFYPGNITKIKQGDGSIKVWIEQKDKPAVFSNGARKVKVASVISERYLGKKIVVG
jgi:N utilization substance protein A